jgi:hypothetical protein
MQIINIKRIIGLAVLQLSFVGLTLAFNQGVRLDDEKKRQPDLPAECSSIQIEAGNKVAFHTFAIGVQIYRWNGAAWVFVAPEANLYADAGYHGKVGIHYGGPTWESNSGSYVRAARVPGTGCTPDGSAIPWLLLKMVSSDGPGIFNRVTFIQRTNTSGGLSPSVSGSTVGEEKRVPYTAEYYFYRAQGN